MKRNLLFTFGPEFDCPERHSETFAVGHQMQNFISHSTAVQTTNTLYVQILQQRVVPQVLVSWDDLKGKAGKQHIQLKKNKFIF